MSNSRGLVATIEAMGSDSKLSEEQVFANLNEAYHVNPVELMNNTQGDKNPLVLAVKKRNLAAVKWLLTGERTYRLSFSQIEEALVIALSVRDDLKSNERTVINNREIQDYLFKHHHFNLTYSQRNILAQSIVPCCVLNGNSHGLNHLTRHDLMAGYDFRATIASNLSQCNLDIFCQILDWISKNYQGLKFFAELENVPHIFKKVFDNNRFDLLRELGIHSHLKIDPSTQQKIVQYYQTNKHKKDNKIKVADVKTIFSNTSLHESVIPLVIALQDNQLFDAITHLNERIFLKYLLTEYKNRKISEDFTHYVVHQLAKKLNQKTVGKKENYKEEFDLAWDCYDIKLMNLLVGYCQVYRAFIQDSATIEKTIIAGDIEKLTWYLQNGVVINFPRFVGGPSCPALMTALQHGQFAMVKLLLTYGGICNQTILDLSTKIINSDTNHQRLMGAHYLKAVFFIRQSIHLKGAKYQNAILAAEDAIKNFGKEDKIELARLLHKDNMDGNIIKKLLGEEIYQEATQSVTSELVPLHPQIPASSNLSTLVHSAPLPSNQLSALLLPTIAELPTGDRGDSKASDSQHFNHSNQEPPSVIFHEADDWFLDSKQDSTLSIHQLLSMQGQANVGLASNIPSQNILEEEFEGSSARESKQVINANSIYQPATDQIEGLSVNLESKVTVTTDSTLTDSSRFKSSPTTPADSKHEIFSVEEEPGNPRFRLFNYEDIARQLKVLCSEEDFWQGHEIREQLKSFLATHYPADNSQQIPQRLKK